MTYQPCHHSGGRVPKDAAQRNSYAAALPVHPTTCSERLRAFYVEKLRPRGVALELVLAPAQRVELLAGLGGLVGCVVGVRDRWSRAMGPP